MRSEAPDPRRLDLVRLADADTATDGDWPTADLARLVEDAPPAGDGRVRWQAQVDWRSAPGGAREPWLQLRASTTVRLTCQRCLQPMEEALEVERSFRFVADEAEAERLDEEAEEDVLPLPPRGLLDLRTLVEDELILALPLVPRHEVCPQPLPLPSEAPEEAPAEHPFAALAALKHRQR